MTFDVAGLSRRGVNLSRQANCRQNTTFMEYIYRQETQEDRLNQHVLIPAATIRKPAPGNSTVDDRILVNTQTGEIFLNAPGLSLHFPMLVVRHGQTNGNVKRTFQGQIDGPENQLNHVGKAQVKKAAKGVYAELTGLLGAHLKDFAGSGRLILLSSPLSRAQETANAFVQEFEQQTGITLTCTLEKDLAEICFGVIEGHTFEEIKDPELQELIERFRLNQDAIVDWKGTGESFLDVVTRANQLLERLNAQYDGKDVFVISFAHGTLINALRVAVGDRALIEENGLIAFRKHHVDNAQPYWLGHSQQLAEQLCERAVPKSA